MELGEALYVTIIGMSTVLISLLIVSVVINMIKLFVAEKEKTKITSSENKNSQVSSGDPSHIKTNIRNQENNKRIVAAITAVLAVILDKSEPSQFIVNKITRINNHNTE